MHAELALILGVLLVRISKDWEVLHRNARDLFGTLCLYKRQKLSGAQSVLDGLVDVGFNAGFQLVFLRAIPSSHTESFLEVSTDGLFENIYE